MGTGPPAGAGAPLWIRDPWFVSIPIRSDRIWQAMHAVKNSDNG
jgi:hypothetical protein